jgi:hypothetical protein
MFQLGDEGHTLTVFIIFLTNFEQNGVEPKNTDK